MTRNYELDQLQAKQQAAFERKQAAYQRYDEAKQCAQEAYDIMQEAWQERCDARDEMNREYETRQAAFERNNRIWDDYKRIRDENNYQIEHLRRDADTEHQAMIDCFERASAAYESGEKADASMYSSEGHDHQDRRNDLNAEVSRLAQEIKDARANAEATAPKVDSSPFHAAKDRFEQAKARHQAAETGFKREKAARNDAKSEFNRLQADFLRAQDAFQKKLAEVKAERETKQRNTENVVSTVTGHFGKRAAKVRKRKDGKTDIFFSSGSKGDNVGHGHIVIDDSGSVHYAREEWQDKRTEYLIDEAKEDHTRI